MLQSPIFGIERHIFPATMSAVSTSSRQPMAMPLLWSCLDCKNWPHPRSYLFPGSVWVYPEVKVWLTYPTLMVSSVPEIPGAWLKPLLRLHYSPTSPSTESYCFPFLSFLSKKLVPYQLFTYPCLRICSEYTLRANISVTPLKLDFQTFSFMKTPFKSFRMSYVFLSDWPCLLSLL